MDLPGATAAAPAQETDARLARRIHLPRMIGLGLGAACVGGGLAQVEAGPWLWGLLLVNGFAWPQLAWLWAERSRNPLAAEHRNLVLDSAFGGFWVPAMGFNVLPSVLIVTMLTMNNLAVGGIKLFARGALAQLLGAAVAWALLDVRIEPDATLPTILASLPFLVAYPLAIGWINHLLSTRLSQQKMELARSERLHRATLDALEAGVVMYDADDRLVLCNREFRAQYEPIAASLLPGRRFEDVLRDAVARGLIPEASGREEEWIRARLAEHADPGGGAFQRQEANGRWRRIVERRLPDGSLLAFATDVTDFVQREHELRQSNAERDAYARAIEEANAKLERLSETDDLTGLANRRHFHRRLAEEWQWARRHESPLAVVMIDVDHFKRYNDCYGHPQGDACLRQVAAALRECAQRATDVVARYGGEEFKLLLPEIDGAQALQVAQRCLAAIDAAAIPHADSPVAACVTVSIGIGVARPADGAAEIGTLLCEADDALYRAKRSGRHRIEL